MPEDNVEIFKVYLGLSQVEFVVLFNKETNLYQATVNTMVFAESSDYEAVRSQMLSGMEAYKSATNLH